MSQLRNDRCQDRHRRTVGSIPGALPLSQARRLLLAIGLALGLASAAPGPAAAEGSPARKLGRSVANLSLGALAIPGQVMRTSQDSGPFVGLTWGLVKGVALTAATEVVGLFELFSFPFATPPGYEPIMKPEFPWQYFIETERRDPAR